LPSLCLQGLFQGQAAGGQESQGTVIALYVTTSRKPGLKTKAFARELAKSFPSAHYFSRGKKPIKAVVGDAEYQGQKAVVIVQEKHGNPVSWQGLGIKHGEWQYSFQARVKVLKLRKELSKAKHAFEDLEVKVKDKDLKKLFKLLGVESEESANQLREEKKVFSFYSQGNELGPRLKLEAVEFE